MTWLELIRVRTIYEAGSVLSYLMTVRKTLAEMPELKKVEIYTGLTASTDIAIHLVWESKAPPRYGSETGQRMVSDLRRFGLVDHNTWLRKKVPDTAPGRDAKKAGLHPS